MTTSTMIMKFRTFCLLFCLLNALTINVIAQNNVNDATPIKEPQGVDMGGSVLWSTTNLFAETPDEVGIYCGWGDPTGDLKFQGYNPEEENYMDPETCLAMYGGLQPDNNIAGSDIDIVHRHLSNGWQMPSSRHFDELHDCKWELAKINDTLGYKVTALNGNSIFLPAWNNEPSIENGVKVAYGGYWTADICHLYLSLEDNGFGAYIYNLAYTPWWLESEEYDCGLVTVDGSNILMAADRWNQLMVRPVKPKSVKK